MPLVPVKPSGRAPRRTATRCVVALTLLGFLSAACGNGVDQGAGTPATSNAVTTSAAAMPSASATSASAPSASSTSTPAPTPRATSTAASASESAPTSDHPAESAETARSEPGSARTLPAPVIAECPAGTAPATKRIASVYAAALTTLLEGQISERPLRRLYVVARYTPDEMAREDAEAEGSTPPPLVAADTAPFPTALRKCLEAPGFGVLPPVTLVRDSDDPAIKREPVTTAKDKDYGTPVVEGVVITLSRVSGAGAAAEVSVAANYGFDDQEGATYTAKETPKGWQLTGGEQWIT